MSQQVQPEEGRTDAPSKVAQQSSPPNTATGPRALPPEPNWVRYDPELERLCRIAASVGATQAAPISYTALVIAFLFGNDQVSEWFQSYVRRPEIHLDEIYRSKGTGPEARGEHLSRADSGVLPAATPLYSRSVRNVMEQATRVARDVAREEFTALTLGPRHVMAAYAFRNPSDHQDQVRGWGFREDD
jgi:hypothetical protein